MTTLVKFYVPYQVVSSQLQLQIITNFHLSYAICENNALQCTTRILWGIVLHIVFKSSVLDGTKKRAQLSTPKKVFAGSYSLFYCNNTYVYTRKFGVNRVQFGENHFLGIGLERIGFFYFFHRKDFLFVESVFF